MTSATLVAAPSARTDLPFERRFAAMLNDAATVLMISVGHRTGLFDALASLRSATSGELALRAGLQERYVREWLGAMLAGGIVTKQRADGRYALPAAQAAFLTRAATPQNLAASAQWIAVLGGVEDAVVECFVEGGGVPYAAYARFHQVMADESAQTVVAVLDEHVLPLVPGLERALARGLDVLDVGCGSGRALLHLARRFPASRFTGYDLEAPAIESAREQARRARVPNARFEVRDAALLEEQAAYDLVTSFDAIHDQARPDLALAAIRRALRPGGTYLMQEIRAHSEPADNVEHPLGAFLYTISCMHCMTVSLASGGLGLGACWGRERAHALLGEAGFREIERHELAHDVMNDWWVAR